MIKKAIRLIFVLFFISCSNYKYEVDIPTSLVPLVLSKDFSTYENYEYKKLISSGNKLKTNDFLLFHRLNNLDAFYPFPFLDDISPYVIIDVLLKNESSVRVIIKSPRFYLKLRNMQWFENYLRSSEFIYINLNVSICNIDSYLKDIALSEKKMKEFDFKKYKIKDLKEKFFDDNGYYLKREYLKVVERDLSSSHEYDSSGPKGVYSEAPFLDDKKTSNDQQCIFKGVNSIKISKQEIYENYLKYYFIKKGYIVFHDYSINNWGIKCY